MITSNRNFFSSLMASMFSMCGCGQPSTSSPATKFEPTIVEEIQLSGFDPDGEPVIKKWSDGSLGIHFEAMPPFFAEDEGLEADFENFEIRMQEACGVTVQREDREVFHIANPQADTATRIQSWLESYRDVQP